MPLATLSIDIVAQLAKMQEGLDKAYRLNEQTASKIEARWKAMEGGADKLGKMIGAAFAGRELVQFSAVTIDAIDALNDAADATGSTIENLSALEDIARRSGGTMTDVTGAVVKFNSVLKEADGKNAVSRALKAIGMDAEELRRLDPAEALRQTAMALSQFADDGEKARLVQVLFGKSVSEVAPFLKELGEQAQLVGTITSEQAKEAEKFNKQIAELKTHAEDAARVIASSLLPVLNQIFERAKRGGLSSVLGLDEIGANNTRLKAGAAAISAGLELERAKLDIFSKTLNPQGYEANIARLQAAAEKAKAEAKVASDAYFKITDGSAGGGRGFINPPLVAPGIELPPNDKKDGKGEDKPFVLVGPTIDFSFLRQRNEAQRDLVNALGQTPRDEIESLQTLLNSLQEYVAEGGDVEKAAQAAMKANERLAALMGGDSPIGPAIDVSYLQQRNEAQRDLNNILGQTPQAQVESLQSLLKSLQEYVAEGGDPGKAGQAVKMVNDRLAELQDTTSELSKTFQQGLGDSLRMALGGDFDQIGRMWQNLLADMAAKALEKDIGRYLFGDGSSGSGVDWGQAISTVAGFFGFASGGDHAGGFRIVGENGPELEATGPARIFSADQTRAIFGASSAGSSGGAKTVNNITVQQGLGAADVYNAVQRGLAEANAYTDRKLRRAGAY